MPLSVDAGAKAVKCHKCLLKEPKRNLPIIIATTKS